MDRNRFFHLVAETQKSAADIALLQTAYWLSKNAHHKQKRDDGERYFEHPRRVATSLLEHEHSQTSTLILALLHDVVEDTETPLPVIVNLFGAEIWNGLNLLSKQIPNFDPVTGMNTRSGKKPIDAYFRAIAEGPKSVRLVKCADRLDNLQDIETFSAERRARQLTETRDYILPIAAETCPIYARELRAICERYPA